MEGVNTAEVHKALKEMIGVLASAIEKRDFHAVGHQQRVTKLAVAIARQMKIPQDQCEAVEIAAMVHDVGKIEIPAEVLSKPMQLTKMEFSVVANHPMASYNLIKHVHFPRSVSKIVLQHHEKMDGSGYPQCLSGDEILPEARILVVADVIAAMTADRPHRSALSLDIAIDEIKQKKGILYYDAVVDACVELLAGGNFSL